MAACQELRAACDIVNIDLLLKRLRIIGLPTRFFYLDRGVAKKQVFLCGHLWREFIPV
jgi:hypothetical protein